MTSNSLKNHEIFEQGFTLLLHTRKTELERVTCLGFPDGAVAKNPPASAGDTGSSPGPGRSHMPRSN